MKTFLSSKKAQIAEILNVPIVRCHLNGFEYDGRTGEIYLNKSFNYL